jgi:hypothetical protein
MRGARAADLPHRLAGTLRAQSLRRLVTVPVVESACGSCVPFNPSAHDVGGRWLAAAVGPEVCVAPHEHASRCAPERAARSTRFKATEG